MNKQNKILLIGIILIIFVAVIGVAYVEITKTPDVSFEFPKPAEVVRQYFDLWNKKNYPDMYSTVSDGFKKIEPTARNLSSFRDYVNSQNISQINILNLKETFNDGSTAKVYYSVKFLFNSSERNFTGTYTLKLRTGDIIFGWKLVHPYGDKIDTS